MVMLEPGLTIQGRVLDEAGKPMPGVLLFPQTSGEAEDPSDSYATGGAATDRRGRCALSNARHDMIALSVFADGYCVLKQDIYPGKETLLYPQPAGKLAG